MELLVALDDLKKTTVRVNCDSWEVANGRLSCSTGDETVGWFNLSQVRYFGRRENIRPESRDYYGRSQMDDPEYRAAQYDKNDKLRNLVDSMVNIPGGLTLCHKERLTVPMGDPCPKCGADGVKDCY